MDPRLSLPELRGLYQPLKLIGKGASGLVYKATRDGTVYAVKRLLQTVPPDTCAWKCCCYGSWGSDSAETSLTWWH